nr:ribonuclease H-like domain-containing protein [Tanacetum cinerariifolium]
MYGQHPNISHPNQLAYPLDPPAHLYIPTQHVILAQQLHYPCLGSAQQAIPTHTVTLVIKPVAPLGSTGSTVISEQATTLPHAFTIGKLHDPDSGAWNIDTGASSYLNNSVNSVSENFNTCMYPSISVGDGHSIPVTNTGHSILPTPFKSLHLNNVLIIPHIVKNLISVCQFFHDNNCTIEFDTFGFFVKDFMTRRVLLRCDSTMDLYPVTALSHIPHAFLVSQHTWHQRLGHPWGEVLRRLVSSNFISYNKEKPLVLCHACQLGKYVRLLFVSSSTVIRSCFDVIHSDLDGVNVGETFSLVVKLGTIRTVLSLAASRHWSIHQLDVKNAFLHGDLSETVYMHQPFGFRDSVHPDYVCLLQRDIAVGILEQAGMVNYNLSRTPVDTESKLGETGDMVSDPTLYQSLADLVVYSDADWAGCPTTRRSTSGYYVFLRNNLLSWSFKRQPTLSCSSTEAEYRGVANAVAETCCLRNLLCELHSPLSSATLVYCDNVSVVYLSSNPVQHQRTKHIEIDIHFVRDLVAAGHVRVMHVPSCYQYADIFTKGLPSALFEEFRSSLSFRCPPALIAGEC